LTEINASYILVLAYLIQQPHEFWGCVELLKQ